MVMSAQFNFQVIFLTKDGVKINLGAIAQLARASALQAECQEFESL